MVLQVRSFILGLGRSLGQSQKEQGRRLPNVPELVTNINTFELDVT